MLFFDEYKLRKLGVEYIKDYPLSKLTTFRLGGPADIAIFPGCEEEVQKTLTQCSESGTPCVVLGNGSNIIAGDKGFRGAVIVIGPKLSLLETSGNIIKAGAGIALARLSREALSSSLMGLEWAGGIPGALGGACAMNAGAYGSCMADVLKRVRYIENGTIVEQDIEKAEFGYRQSQYLAPRRVVVGATLELAADDGCAAQRYEDYMRLRNQKQPVTKFSAGSIFKRPEGHFAGALIESAKLKGMRVGGAYVSELHAGFILNDGTATAAEVLELIELVKNTVLCVHGVELECEVRTIGEF